MEAAVTPAGKLVTNTRLPLPVKKLADNASIKEFLLRKAPCILNMGL